MRQIWMRAEARKLNGRSNKKAVVVVSAEGWRRKTNAKATLRSSFAASPLRGSDLKIKRSKDRQREVEL